MKNSAIIRIVIFSITIILLTGLLIGGLTFNAVWDFGRPFFNGEQGGISGGTAASTGSVDAASIQNIDIQWIGGSITIQPGDTRSIEFSETPGLEGEEQMVWKQVGNTLQIFFRRTMASFPSFGISADVKKDLVLTVPRDWEGGELAITSVSAKVTVTEQTFREIDLDNVSGRCEFTDCFVDGLTFTTVSGDVHFSGSAGKLDCETVSGDCTASLSGTPQELELESVSGDMTLILPDISGFTATIDSVSGDISTDFPATVSNGRYTYGDGRCRIDGDTVSGDLIIRSGGN